MKSANAVAVNQYLTFNLSGELQAVEVSSVREVLEMMPLTRLPKTPPFLKGVINVRESVVPVVDLRLRLGLEDLEDTVETCIVVLELEGADRTVVIGVRVDSVEEVVEITDENIEPPPRFGLQLDTEFIKGIGKKDDRFIILLDLYNLFDDKELSALRELDHTVSSAAGTEA